jgi:hypothetical protein
VEDFPKLDVYVYIRKEGEDNFWKKYHLRNELGMIRIWKKGTRHHENFMEVMGDDIMDIRTPMNSQEDLHTNTSIILVLKERNIVMCAETTKVR